MVNDRCLSGCSCLLLSGVFCLGLCSDLDNIDSLVFIGDVCMRCYFYIFTVKIFKCHHLPACNSRRIEREDQIYNTVCLFRPEFLLSCDLFSVYFQNITGVLKHQFSPDCIFFPDSQAFIRYMVDQFRLFTEQILAAVYFRVFYGRHCHYLVSEYVDELILAFLTRFYPAASREFIPGSDRAKLLEQVANFVSYLLEGYWKRPPGDADELHNYLCAFPITVGPRVWDTEKYPNYLPLIAYLNTDAGKVVEGFSALGLTTFRFTGSVNYEPDASHGSNYIRLDSYNHPIGSSFSCEGTPCDKGNIEILRYLSHFNLSGVSIEKIFCSLIEMAFSLDIKRPGMSSTQIFCACLYASLNKVVTLSGTSRKGMTEVEKYAPGCYEETVKFLKYAVETYGVTVNIPLITTRFIFSLMDKAKQKDTVEKIHEAGGSASADNLATTESWWVSQEALQFISQKADNASTAQSQVAESKTSTTEKGNNTSHHQNKGEVLDHCRYFCHNL